MLFPAGCSGTRASIGGTTPGSISRTRPVSGLPTPSKLKAPEISRYYEACGLVYYFNHTCVFSSCNKCVSVSHGFKPLVRSSLCRVCAISQQAVFLYKLIYLVMGVYKCMKYYNLWNSHWSTKIVSHWYNKTSKFGHTFQYEENKCPAVCIYCIMWIYLDTYYI